MIQRIQSLWLLLSTVCAMIIYLIPTFAGSSNDGTVKIFSVRESLLLMFLISAVALCSFVNIFLFRNRKRQKGIIVITTLAICCFILIQYLLVAQFKKDFQIVQGTWELTAMLPIFMVFFQVFAFMGIRKDEKILSSADRIR